MLMMMMMMMMVMMMTKHSLEILCSVEVVVFYMAINTAR